MAYRIGSGVDFHKLAEGRKLWIGGVNIPHTKGALGLSDADVLLHAICDALLGAGETERIRQWVLCNTTARRSQVREVQSEDVILQTKTCSEITAVTSCFIFPEITSTECKLVVIPVLSTQ